MLGQSPRVSSQIRGKEKLHLCFGPHTFRIALIAGLAKCVIDKKVIEQVFSSRELEDIIKFNNWVMCDNCDKWRLLPDGQDDNVEELPQWFCEMNPDLRHNSCDAPQRDDAWHEKDRAQKMRKTAKGQNANGSSIAGEGSSLSLSVEEMKDLEEKDPILQHILNIKGRPVSKHIFHEVLTKEKEFNLDAVAVHNSDDDSDKKLKAREISYKASNESASVPTAPVKQEATPRVLPMDPPGVVGGEVECIVLSSDEE